MKIVVLDGYTENPGDISWEGLERLGELTVYPRTPADQIVERIADAEAVFTNKTPLTAETIQSAANLKFIGVLATGYNIVDSAAARAKNIDVTNIPTYGTAAVAQMAFALLLEVCHHVGDHDLAVKRGDWTNNQDWSFWNHPLIELADKTMGIIGLGRIGQSTAAIAQAFGMKVLAYDSYQNASLESDTLRFCSLEELLAESDVISLHCPLFPETQGIINSKTIAQMKTGVIILNTSRGPLVNEQDMAEALYSGKIGYFAADVVSTEPIKEDNPLMKTPRTILTPHIAWAPKESRMRLMDIAVDNLRQFIAGTPINVVN